MTTAAELRQAYLEYFVKQHGHTLVASSPIVPPDDPTMLFTSAGMVQFKPLYAGTVDPLPYRRAASCQKCLRAGGKASDLENVGKTLRHHTFFEMLGNFSFGDYFKREAMLWGWDFVWNHMKLPKERLWATTFENDPEAAEMLEKEVGIPRSRIIPLDAKENFWGPAGDSGACGPCSEICFFMGSEAELKKAMEQDVPTIARRIVEEGDLFLEIWNMVFPQFDQQKDGSRPPLKNKGIDTGAGLERMTTVLNFVETKGKVHGPYETGLMLPIVRGARELLGLRDPGDPNARETDRDSSARFWTNAIADHARALTFALSEGIVPSNDGRGYVLRRILRRAGRFGHLLGMERPFIHKLVEPVVEVMSPTYPELKEHADHVSNLIRIEEERFMRTVAQGTRILDEKISEAKDRGDGSLKGEDIFLLHATYGYPPDLTAEIAEDAGLQLDKQGYAQAMKRHQDDARKSWKGAALGGEADLLGDIYETQGETEFVGYDTLECHAAVLAIIKNGARVQSADEGDEVTVVLDQSPFYAESGGQVGDTGLLEAENGGALVSDTQKTPSGIFLHRGKAKGKITVGDTATARVNGERRMAIMRNHTVTHLLQAALKRVVGKHVTQSGSWVGPTGMRFDFSHSQACSAEELARVERMVNEFILQSAGVHIEEMPIEDARKRGAIAPFGEKYGHQVRVVQIGANPPVSIEFCGGAHLDRVDRIGSFRIMAESSVAAGIRRIEGVTGMGAYEAWSGTRDVVARLCRSLAVKEEQVQERVAALQDEIKKLNKDIKKAKQSAPSFSPEQLIAGAEEIDGIQVICARIDGADADTLRQTADLLRDRLPRLVCFLGSAEGDKVSIVAAVSKSETKRLQAGAIIKQVAAIVGGGGGGRPDLAQAGGKLPEKLDEAVKQAKELVREILEG